MIAIFAEAVRDLLLPCSLTLVVPGVAAVLAARRNPLPVYGGTLFGSVVIAWMRISEQIPARLVAPWIWVLGTAVVVSFGALRLDQTRLAQRVTAAVVVGGAASWIWTPCVGSELGVLLNRAPADPLGTLVPFSTFVFGLSSVALVVALAREAAQLPERFETWVSRVSTVIGWIIGVAIATGWYLEMVAQLVNWSL